MKCKLSALLATALICLLAAFALAGCSGSGKSAASDSKSADTTMEARDTPADESAAEQPANEVSDKPFYALLVGSDSRYGTYKGKKIKEDDPSYGDTIMLVRVDPKTYNFSILSIPRDTAIETDAGPEKINSSHLEGIDNMIYEIEDLVGKKVTYYFEMKFFEFEDYIDAIGGVDAYVPLDMSWTDVVKGGQISLSAGDQHLSGPQALILVRQRKQYGDNGEAYRQLNARNFMETLIRQLASGDPDDAGEYAKLLNSFCKTNMDEETLTAYMKLFMEHADDLKFQLGTGPYTGDIDWSGMWRAPRDPEAYAALAQAMEDETDMSGIVAPPVL